jgi:RNA polymerase sigma-70 factor (ECF subfamily)
VTQDELYREAVSRYGAAIERLVRAYEMDRDKRRDLSQEIHFALWRSFKLYEARCSLGTWVYRIAHNTAASHIVGQRKSNIRNLVNLDDLVEAPSKDSAQESEDRLVLDKLFKLIHQLRPLDRELMVLYLEGIDAQSISEITGISPGNVRTQIYRIKSLLAKRFQSGGPA